MNTNARNITSQQREALIVLAAISFIEEHGLLRREELEEAKASLQALFLRTTSQAALLHKLIGVLHATKNIHQSFASIANIIAGVARGVATVDDKIAQLRAELERRSPSAEEHRDFIGPFLHFTQQFQHKLAAFARSMELYTQLKENEARLAQIYRVAREARDQIKERLNSRLGGEPRGETESRIRREVISSFDYSKAKEDLQIAVIEARGRDKEIHAQLDDIKRMCQMAMNPAMREQPASSRPTAAGEGHDDVFALFTAALRKHPPLAAIRDQVLEFFRLYQHSYGMFVLDYNHLQSAIETMMKNPGGYFEAKEEDRDTRAKREKLRRIEGLIPFLERSARMLGDKELATYPVFTRRLSEVIGDKKAPWSHVAEELLRAKVQAEAEMSTRL